MATNKKFHQADQATTRASASAQSIIIKQPEVAHIALEVSGKVVIQNCFGQKAVEQMLRKHMGLPCPKEIKIPRQCIENATIRNLDGRVCLPPTAFKKGMLTAVGMLGDKSLKKTNLRTGLYVVGGSLPITSGPMIPRMDMVRTSGMNRTPDVRFRPSFPDWKCRMEITFDPSVIKTQTVVDLLNRAGMVGVGEWRPERDGTFGTYQVTRNITDPKELAEVRTECATQLVALVIPDWAMDAEIDADLLRRIAGGQPETTDAEETVEGTVLPDDLLDSEVDDTQAKRILNRKRAS